MPVMQLGRAEEEFGNLRRTFEAFKGSQPFPADNLILFSAVTSHYIQDAHQPLHTSNNFGARKST